MPPLDLIELEAFIVQAKAATYAAAAPHRVAVRPGAHEIEFRSAEFSYVDSYFGGTDFIGQEVVYQRGSPVWAMNYYGRILEPDLLNAADAGRVVQKSLSELYRGGRFLGGITVDVEDMRYVDTNDGDVRSFRGVEWIVREGRRAYELVYNGGLVFD